ncbi:MAG: hypothetical protein M3Z96_06100 [Pseudomonadota bacterium]|nr:hypothetical protein [Pseudomonadota bacterium]
MLGIPVRFLKPRVCGEYASLLAFASESPERLEIQGDLPDRLALEERLTPNPANRLTRQHCQHSPAARLESNRPVPDDPISRLRLSLWTSLGKTGPAPAAGKPGEEVGDKPVKC